MQDFLIIAFIIIKLKFKHNYNTNKREVSVINIKWKPNFLLAPKLIDIPVFKSTGTIVPTN